MLHTIPQVRLKLLQLFLQSLSTRLLTKGINQDATLSTDPVGGGKKIDHWLTVVGAGGVAVVNEYLQVGYLYSARDSPLLIFLGQRSVELRHPGNGVMIKCTRSKHQRGNGPLNWTVMIYLVWPFRLRPVEFRETFGRLITVEIFQLMNKCA